MIKILTKKFVKEINDFLSNDWDTFVKIWYSGDEYKKKDEQMSRAEILDVISDGIEHGKENERLRNEVRGGLFKLPDFKDEYSELRNFNVNNGGLYKFSDYAENFNSFRIDKFNPDRLNDQQETKWFDYFINIWRTSGAIPTVKSHFDKLMKKVTILSTYTTTTKINHKYMISNYSEKKKTSMDYSKKQVFKSYDSLFSLSIRPIRGFVRYDRIGKSDYISYVLGKKSNPKVFEILLAIGAFFFKGACMSEEAEYRFMLLTNNDLNAVELSCVDMKLCKYSCSTHDKNEFYNGTISATRCDSISTHKHERCNACRNYR